MVSNPSRHLLQRNLDKAAGLLNNGRRNVAGLLAQAAVAFELGDHAGALASYRNALKEFPGCPPEVRTQAVTLPANPRCSSTLSLVVLQSPAGSLRGSDSATVVLPLRHDALNSTRRSLDPRPSHSATGQARHRRLSVPAGRLRACSAGVPPRPAAVPGQHGGAGGARCAVHERADADAGAHHRGSAAAVPGNAVIC